ncbi:hypothetical protein FVB32_16110 [Flagellimonas hymeniacidonis]|uniref:Uncharacterized protein n=1 Tax=Flagellimonas hymeniacidonis TaxID=2603628 RepID=A0A5C8V4Y6_9FLAO|nr:hypothetical protein [Flagellimonas hymeniacidonis]TXN36082.1 hypothetical protein FVB32_16110 [Flagellimonas hymeniacidonis]
MEETKQMILMENLKRLVSGEAAPCYLTSRGFEYGKAEGSRIDLDGLEPVIEFIHTHLRRTESINTSQTSYGLKSIYERCNREQISNGLWIAAMLACGYMCRPAEPFSTEVHFNVYSVSRRGEHKITGGIALEKEEKRV